MSYLMCVLLLGLVLGLVAVASNPSPYFAAMGLVVVAGVGCGVLVGTGGCFLSLVLFLIYLGGMLVVFAYSAAMAAEPFPEGWGSWPTLRLVGGYLVGVAVARGLLGKNWYEEDWSGFDSILGLTVLRGDVGGVSLMYSSGGWLLMGGGWVLLLTLFVVLELTRGLGRGALRAV
ncbi:NADH dehydrogenase subunit 6 (mitochondrion) [Gambusia affinis]|uniref:NADH-ubiquinone oxidoreductase chain 6 n=1 Tax=Gambusia affinis TaxID=33528 RepID=Q8HLV2_GAMAF|nr:NADH dehydrogenase subunit 6 [Gambusia affinis]UXB58287.1 NADH dehydrogenase subunit 6 [Gambusia affinis]UXB58300.1 NADH dehydrogenase subunit 6 [Gambusia affinis]BAC23396.1 NADH dehydrogenase subunit 6 [Gambusia affinis]